MVIGSFSAANSGIEFDLTVNENVTEQGSSGEGSSSIKWKVIFDGSSSGALTAQ